MSVVHRHWRWVIGTLLIVVGVVALFTLTREETYESSAEVQILTEQNHNLFAVNDEALFRVATAELQYLASERFGALVDEKAEHPVEFTSREILVSTNEEPTEAGLLRVTSTAGSAGQATADAAAIAETYLESRVTETRALYTRSRDAYEEARVEAVATRSALNAELAALTAEVNAAANPAEASALQADLDLLTAEGTPRIELLNSAIAELSTEVALANQTLTVLEFPDSTARLSSQATTPNAPVSPDVPRNIMIAAVVGLFLGLVLAITRDLLDTRARDGKMLAELVEIPVMATIGEIPAQRSAPGHVRPYGELSAQESSGYQVLLNSLWLSNVDDPLQSIVFTSDRPGVGKTQTVVNLAQAEAARGTRVLVIDTDFASPSVASRLDVTVGEFGLADLLEGTVPMEAAVLPTGIDNVSIVDPRGVEASGELLRSDRLGGVLSDLYAHYDLILIDSPPTLSTSDSRLVASQADAVVVVYDPAQSRRDELQRTIDLLRSARANLIGLVANRTRASHPIFLGQRDR